MSKAKNFIDETSRYMQTAYDRGLMARRPQYQNVSVYDYRSKEAIPNLINAAQLLNEAANILGRDRNNAQYANRLKMIANQVIDIYNNVAPQETL